MLLGLLTAPPDYRTKLNAYLEQHGAFIAEDEPATTTPDDRSHHAADHDEHQDR